MWVRKERRLKPSPGLGWEEDFRGIVFLLVQLHYSRLKNEGQKSPKPFYKGSSVGVYDRMRVSAVNPIPTPAGNSKCKIKNSKSGATPRRKTALGNTHQEKGNPNFELWILNSELERSDGSRFTSMCWEMTETTRVARGYSVVKVLLPSGARENSCGVRGKVIWFPMYDRVSIFVNPQFQNSDLWNSKPGTPSSSGRWV